jgi:hypothetical protein
MGDVAEPAMFAFIAAELTVFDKWYVRYSIASHGTR